MGHREAWLAGLIDGEGCFTLSISIQHKHSLRISPKFSISMRSGIWVRAAGSILRFNRIPFHSRLRRNQDEIVVSGIQAVSRLLRLTIPYLVVKKPLAVRLADFPRAPRRNAFTPINSAYLERICNLVDYVRRFNRGKNRKHRWNGEAVRRFYQE